MGDTASLDLLWLHKYIYFCERVKLSVSQVKSSFVQLETICFIINCLHGKIIIQWCQFKIDWLLCVATNIVIILLLLEVYFFLIS